jgi:hypothetical protein
VGHKGEAPIDTSDAVGVDNPFADHGRTSFFCEDWPLDYHGLIPSPNASIFAIKGKGEGFLEDSLLTHPSLQSQGPSKTAQVPQNYRILTRPSLQSATDPLSHPYGQIWLGGSGWPAECGFFQLSQGYCHDRLSSSPGGIGPIVSDTASD